MACLEFTCHECGYYWTNNGLHYQICPKCGHRCCDWYEERERELDEKLDIEPKEET